MPNYNDYSIGAYGNMIVDERRKVTPRDNRHGLKLSLAAPIVTKS